MLYTAYVCSGNGFSCLFQVDGEWDDWSDWFKCAYSTSFSKFLASTSTTPDDSCQCRTRDCSRPYPANGGSDCVGTGLEVTNCTQHGQWTMWSDWSPCSKTCDIGMRQRKRQCGNPAPAFGGRRCIGRDVDTQICDDLPPCTPTKSAASASLVRESALVGNWAGWSEWSECSAAECGKGFRTRRRKCFDNNCGKGCDKQYEECEDKKCSGLMDVTDWTPWIKSNSSLGGAWYEKRFRFTYRSPVSVDQVGQVNAEERFCTSTNQCSVTSISQKESQQSRPRNWSEWSKCTRECGTGYQVRLRDCPIGDRGCLGYTIAERACNTQPCMGHWSCWSAWSECDHLGKKRRTRDCQSLSSQLRDSSSSLSCSGGSSYEEMSCDGWGMWTDWSMCDHEQGDQVRYRSCVAQQCQGSDSEKRQCDGSTTLIPAPGTQQSGVNAIIGACILGFILGMGVGAGLVYYFLIYRRGLSGAHGSPHYVSAKSQNLYVSLPMLDLKHKHLASSAGSECGTMRSTTTAGTLRSKASSSIYSHGGRQNGAVVNGVNSDYETATIKRSHSQRNSSLLNGGAHGYHGTAMRADLDSDQLFT